MNKIFNETDALENTAGDRDLLAEVVGFTLEDIPLLIEGISRALDKGDWSEASRLAHKAKGSAGACGAEELYGYALELELAGRDEDPSCSSYLELMKDAFRKFREHSAIRELAALDGPGTASIG